MIVVSINCLPARGRKALWNFWFGFGLMFCVALLILKRGVCILHRILELSLMTLRCLVCERTCLLRLSQLELRESERFKGCG